MEEIDEENITKDEWQAKRRDMAILAVAVKFADGTFNRKWILEEYKTHEAFLVKYKRDRLVNRHFPRGHYAEDTFRDMAGIIGSHHTCKYVPHHSKKQIYFDSAEADGRFKVTIPWNENCREVQEMQKLMANWFDGWPLVTIQQDQYHLGLRTMIGQ